MDGMNGLDLFSGIGGLSLALKPWVRTVAYCERETDTLKLCCCREWLLTNSTERLYGTTLHRSEVPCFHLSTSYSEAFHARTSPLQDVVEAWTASEADFISKSNGLSKKLDLLSSSLKTSLRSGLADLVESSKDWPRSGMIVDGQLYLPQALEPHTKETDGSYLPTPTSQSYGSNKGGAAGRIGKERFSLDTMARKNLWPTPRASEATRGHGGAGNRKEGQKTLSQKIGGQLNPMWVEWLMGFPIGWTVLSAWAMQWFRSKRAKRSKDCQV